MLMFSSVGLWYLWWWRCHPSSSSLITADTRRFKWIRQGSLIWGSWVIAGVWVFKQAEKLSGSSQRITLISSVPSQLYIFPSSLVWMQPSEMSALTDVHPPTLQLEWANKHANVCKLSWGGGQSFLCVSFISQRNIRALSFQFVKTIVIQQMSESFRRGNGRRHWWFFLLSSSGILLKTKQPVYV